MSTDKTFQHKKIKQVQNFRLCRLKSNAFDNKTK